MTALSRLLERFRADALTNREAGTYFEELILKYLTTEPAYRDLYREVLTYADWAERLGMDRRDAGIDLVALTHENEAHAVQCKLFAADYELKKSDIDSFFTASGKQQFAHRLIVSTTNHWSDHAEEALREQRVPVTKIDLYALENSVIDWSRYEPRRDVFVKERKTLRDHQRAAVKEALAHLKTADRGKLIMACGTGKTFTSLKIAEAQAGQGKRVLFLVPSLALLGQSLTEWTQESETALHSYAVCSDSDVGKKRKKDDDVVMTFVHELQYPATTDAAHLAHELDRRHDRTHMSVVFATYQSIDVVHRAQKTHGLPTFDLIICDEAHRTTGAKFEGDDESHFVKVHDDKFVSAKKRIYMTATPRIYGDWAKAAAERDNVALCSMDDVALYGKEFFVITFSEAVKRGLLVDYKVIVLSIDERHVSRRIQQLLKDENNALRVDDAAKIVGCWKALAKQGLEEQSSGDGEPMQRAVAFCQVIEAKPGAKTHKVASKTIASMFQAVVEAYQTSEAAGPAPVSMLRCEAAHVDGSMNATGKEEKLSWLKADLPPNTCRILSNVRCLSEGVDVPALDAVLFLTPRNSQIDVVQSVGRVMRNAPGKKRGYVVLPVVIPDGMAPHEALNDNQVYRVVWQVLQALRSHDDRFDAMVNKLELIGKDRSKMEVIAITDKVTRRGTSRAQTDAAQAKAGHAFGSSGIGPKQAVQAEMEFEIGEIERAIYAKLVEKVGNRRHWEDWAKDIAKIANSHIGRIAGILENEKNVSERRAFATFATELRDDLNDSISDQDIIEMLAQHMVTKPVFDALFSNHTFTSQNPISKAMQDVLVLLEAHHVDKEAKTLEAFYESVKVRVEGIDTAEGRQKIVVQLYDKFFRNAFPKMSERLGIVYTPVEIVDFILHSVDHLLRTEFGQTMSSEGVHILDPFTGTGTFITRLIQSGLVEREALKRKYRSEIHANELVLLAYYIAAINIESAYHSVVGAEEYSPFEGICLTDTFQLYEKEDLVSALLVDNSARRTRQKKLDIRVIVGNPPYSVGQDRTNDNNANVAYPALDARLASTYAARSDATSSKALYDSYIRAIRWASDRIGSSGIIGFVTNANFVQASGMAGMRRCLADEFSSLYVFHLKGNQRTAGELSRREGGKVFGSGSRAPVAISLLVKNPEAKRHGHVLFRGVGDYLTREQKLEAIASFRDVGGVAATGGWQTIEPDEHGDWLNQRDATFGRFLPLGDKDQPDAAIFVTYSNGVNSGRDAWTRNWSVKAVAEQVGKLIDCYNSELKRFARIAPVAARAERESAFGAEVESDPTKIGWSRGLKNEFIKGTELTFERAKIRPSLYRPYTKQWFYFDRQLNEMLYQMPRLFPLEGGDNLVIGTTHGESRSGYSVLMMNATPSFHTADMVGSQYFPRYVYDIETGTRRDAISDGGLRHFQNFYPAEEISKDDLFYYVYGVLHSPDYRERYSDNLGKELARIPRVSSADHFWAFSNAGRRLSGLHVGYEQVSEYEKVLLEIPAKADFRVEKMRFAKGTTGKDKDRSTIHYNAAITVRGIPLDAYEYVVNGKSAIEWVMERQGVSTDKESGITKDANAFAKETMKDPRYPLSLLLRVITVSLETNRIVAALPRIDDAALEREDQEHIFGRLRAVAVRLQRHHHGPPDATKVEWVADEVKEQPGGYVVTMLDGHGRPVEYVHLDLKEQITQRVRA